MSQKNDNRVDSFIWHLRVGTYFSISSYIPEKFNGKMMPRDTTVTIDKNIRQKI